MRQTLNGTSYLPLLAVAILALSLGLACGASASVSPDALSPQDLEAQAQSIDESLICPACPGKTIGQAQVEQAAQMRQLVRQKLSEGWSRQEILDYFADRYDEGVLAEPPRQGFTLLAWLLPPVGMVGGGVALYFVLRAMRKGRGQQAPDDGLTSYLDRVDQDLGRSPSPPLPPPSVPPMDSGEA